MKKILLLLFAPILFSAHVNAQSKGLLSLSLGPSLPLGEYGNKDANGPASGLASLGALADVSYQHLFKDKRFGWIATLRYRFNGVDKNATLAPFASEFPTFEWSMNHPHWMTAQALAGGYYQRSLTPRLTLSASIQLGLAEVWFAKESIQGLRDSVGFGPTDLKQASLHAGPATAFTGLAGVGGRYQWKGGWSFVARLDYNYLKPTFHNTEAVLVQGYRAVIPGLLLWDNFVSWTINYESRNYTQPMSSLDLSIGVCREL